MYRSGYGAFTFSDGSTLSGTFANDELNGFGIYAFPNGHRIEGDWSNGELNGPVTEYEYTTLTFQGTYVNNERNGHGICYNTDGGVFDGEWRNGLFHGKNNTWWYPDALPERCSLRGEWKVTIKYRMLLLQRTHALHIAIHY